MRKAEMRSLVRFRLLYDYATWGCLKTEEKIYPNVHQPFRLQNQYCDTETGLHYNFFRYYDPIIGRFTTQDPIGLWGGENFYQFSPNAQIWVDPLGLQYISGSRSNIVRSGKDKANSNTQNLSEWRRAICASSIGKEKSKFLGSDFVKVDAGKWRSLDGKRQFRVTPSDYKSDHGMGVPTVKGQPHVHFEFLEPKQNGQNFTVKKNVHIPLNKCC